MMNSQQLSLDEKKTIIETVIIQPNKEMPEEVFCELWRISYFMELMERVDDNHVIWDENVESIYSETSANAEYEALQNDWLRFTFEIPKETYEQLKFAEDE
jgi:hypothetical protein